MRYLIRFIAWPMLAFGIFGFANEVQALLNGTAEDSLIGFVLCAIFVCAGVALLWAARAPRGDAAVAGLDGKTPEDVILQAAKHHQGFLTATNAAADTPLAFADAQSELDRLAKGPALNNQAV